MISTLRCIVVEVPADQDAATKPVARDLLPWADPYIARLIVKHQLQVAREERAARRDQASVFPDRFPRSRGRLPPR